MAKRTIKRKRRSSKGLSAAPTRRRRSAKKGLLSELFNPTTAMNSAKGTLAASSGGLGAMVVHKSILPPTAGKMTKVLTAFGVGFLAANFNMPMLGAGFTGGLMALTFKDGLMAEDSMQEDTNFADESVLSDMPLFLDEAGNPMILEESNGEASLRYLSADEMALFEDAQSM